MDGMSDHDRTLRNRTDAPDAMYVRPECRTPADLMNAVKLERAQVIMPVGATNVTGTYLVRGPQRPYPREPIWFALVKVYRGSVVAVYQTDDGQ